MGRNIKRILCAALCTSILASSANAGYIYLGGGGGEYTVKTKTWLDKRFHNTVRQKFDFSCGSAAIATLLRYHYQLPLGEQEVIQQMYAAGDQEKIEKQGFSMLDMKSYLGSLGFKADGFKEPLEKLVKVGIPAIVLINRNGYSHFVVVRGVKKDKVLLADPSLGTRVEDRKVFESQWNKILFVITDHTQLAKRTFNTKSAWNFRPKGKFDNERLVSNFDLSRLTLDFAKTPGYY